MNKNWVFILMLGLLVACEKPAKEGRSGNDSSKGKSIPEQGRSLDGDSIDEQVDVPANVAGSFLNCAIRKNGSEADPEMEIGCVLKDPVSKEKIQSSALGWASNTPDVDVLPQPIDALYNVLYRVRGSDLKNLDERARALEAIWSYENKVLNQEKVYNVLKPAIDLEDYEAPIVREQTIARDDDGSL